MTPRELAAISEHSHQRALFAWANCAALYGIAWADRDECYKIETRASLADIVGHPSYEIPPLKRLFAIHNQGHGDAIRGAKAKAEGVKKGCPDVMLPYVVDQWAGLFIELKKPNEKITRDSQRDWSNYLNEAGYQCHECAGWEQAVRRIKLYLWPHLPTHERTVLP